MSSSVLQGAAEYFDRVLTPAAAEMATPARATLFRTIVRQMGADGWLGIGWRSSAAAGRSILDQFIFDAQRANAPFPFVT
jgi:alkylation response protein AidB-like acyl-CoA dehydrogenase